MPNWQALSKEKHANAGWVPPTGYPQAKSDAIAPLLAAELSHALAYYPIVFAPKKEGGFSLNVLLSLESNTNVFINFQDKWMVPYVPASFRSYPFNMMQNAEGKHVLAVDVESSFFHTQALPTDKAVLETDGLASESLKPMINFMQHRLLQQQQTDALVSQLAEKDLIEEWPINLKIGESEDEVRKLGGLFKINELKLQALPESDISNLAKTGALSIAYAQLFSQARMKELRTRFIQYKNQTQGVAPVEQVDLDKLFDGESDSDVFSF